MRSRSEPHTRIGWEPLKDRLLNIRSQVVHGVEVMIADFETPDGRGSVSVRREAYEAHGEDALAEELDFALSLIDEREPKARAPRHAELR